MQNATNSRRQTRHRFDVLGRSHLQAAREFQLGFTLGLCAKRDGDVVLVCPSAVLVTLADVRRYTDCRPAELRRQSVELLTGEPPGEFIDGFGQRHRQLPGFPVAI